MKIILCSSYVPFINGGGRFIVEWLQEKLQIAGHQVERIYLPQVDDPNLIFQQMAAYRWINLTESADRIICLRPPAHIIPHPNKVLWFMHHIRSFYDLWDTEYCTVPHTSKWQGFRQALVEADNFGLKEARNIFTISKCVSDRIKKFNNLDSEVIYPPILTPHLFRYITQNDEIVCISRVEQHKRQHLIIEAMKYTRTPIKLRLCGKSSGEYSQHLDDLITKNRLREKVIFENRWISDTEKLDLLSDCLAVAYLPFDEDYGYPALEAMHASKPILTASDSGGTTELTINNLNGFVCEPDPRALAAAMDELYLNRPLAKKMGQAGSERIEQLQIQWPRVIERLLS